MSPTQSRILRSLIPFALQVALQACSSPALDTSAKAAPTVAQPTNPAIETIVLMGTNDIHGALGPMKLKTKDSDETAYEKGGMTWLAGYIKLLRQEYGSRLLVLDAGDEFQGSIESNTLKGAPMVQFFNTVGINGATLGNHEFDFGQDTLKLRMSEAKYPYVMSNIVEKSTGKRPEFPNTVPHLLLQAGRVKVGVIGLSTRDTPVTTIPDNVKNLDFTDLAEATLREAKALRAKGAQLITVLAHVGQECELPPIVKNQIHKAGEVASDCNKANELSQFLNKLPAGTVDAVITGHSHTLVHHWINGIPVIESGSRGHQFHLIYLDYDLATGKLLADQTRIEGPVPICPKIFKNQGECNGDRQAPKNGRGSLVTPKFRGQEVQEDQQVAQILAPVFASAEVRKNQVVGQAARRIDHPRQSESELGNLLTDALREATGADVALMNSGGIRAPIEAGAIKYGDVFQALPFENTAEVIQVTGKELRQILRVAESGARGYFPVSGVQMRLVGNQYEVSGNDLNHDGRIDPWEVDRLVNVRLSDDKPIVDQKTYRLATVDFLVMGGDDFGWVMKPIPKKRITSAAGPNGENLLIRDVLIQYLGRHQPINTVQAPLVDPAHPRFEFGPPVAKARRGAKKRPAGRRKHG